MISIDPGKNGAIVRWTNGLPITIQNLPYDGKCLDIDLMAQCLLLDDTVVIEDVHTSPRMGVVGAGNFLYNLGVIHTLSFDKTLIKLPPQRWKNVIGLYGKPKAYSLTVVEKLLPEVYDQLIKPYPNRVDRAEAVLMGLAYLKLEGLKR